MKKILYLFAFCFVSTFGFSQQENQQPNDDQLQQQAPKEIQKDTEIAAAKEARKKNYQSKKQKRDAQKRKDAFVERHQTTDDTTKPKTEQVIQKPD